MTISLTSVRKSFGAHFALDGVSLAIEDGEFFVVLGPSGCGKSTLLRSIAGLEMIDSGEITLSGRPVAGQGRHEPPEKRDVGVVFQSYALWPHMTVRGNVAFPMEAAGHSRSEIEARVAECLAMVEMSAYAGRKPAALSGGQRQRVALARCLAQGAGTILMDEPLANLDPHLRGAMEGELAEFHRKSGSTTLFITHDQREAMALADRMALMWDGRILQADRPDVLYARPASERVAGFIGRSSIVDVTVTGARAGSAEIVFGGFRTEVAAAAGVRPGPARLVVRPEYLVAAGAETGFAATVRRIVYRGGFYEADVVTEPGGQTLLVNLPQGARPGERVHLRLGAGWVLPQDPALRPPSEPPVENAREIRPQHAAAAPLLVDEPA